MSLYGRVFAAVYDRCLHVAEDAGLRDARRRLLDRAEGRVLELGSGTGVNLPLYPRDRVTSLVLSEPEEPMLRRLRDRFGGDPLVAELLAAPAERLPLDDASMDTVVATLVLCTVRDLDQALAEAHRVLRPGGRLLFLEHVRSADPSLARRQDRWHGPWRRLAYGCHTNRRTVAAIAAAGFSVEDVEDLDFPRAPAVVRPLALGSARRVAA